jgi:hypothetical protein
MLNKWQRIGVGLSFVWFLGGGYWGNSMGLHKGDFAVTQFDLCMENSSNPGNASGTCLTQFQKDYSGAIKGHWSEAFIMAIIPIPVAWLLVYGLMRVARRRHDIERPV